MSTGYAARFRAYLEVMGKVRDLDNREHNRVAAANSPDNPDKLGNPDNAVRVKVRAKEANKVATNKLEVRQAADKADVRPHNEE